MKMQNNSYQQRKGTKLWDTYKNNLFANNRTIKERIHCSEGSKTGSDRYNVRDRRRAVEWLKPN